MTYKTKVTHAVHYAKSWPEYPPPPSPCVFFSTTIKFLANQQRYESLRNGKQVRRGTVYFTSHPTIFRNRLSPVAVLTLAFHSFQKRAPCKLLKQGCWWITSCPPLRRGLLSSTGAAVGRQGGSFRRGSVESCLGE